MANYNCILCNSKFARKWLLDRHEATVHGVHNYMCNQCPKAFSREDHLERHKQVEHECKFHKCDQCDFTTQWKDSLTRHMDKFHLKSEISDIKNLEQEGSGHPKFACMQCFATFEERKNLNKHIRSVHSDKKFQCKECGMGFNRSDNLERHMQTHNKPEPVKKPIEIKVKKEKEPKKSDRTPLDDGETSAFKRRIVEKK